MRDTRVTVAALRSVLIDPQENLALVRQACVTAQQDGARLLFLPELMLTGHGGHPRMAANAEPVPDGPLAQELLALSARHGLCICAGMAELSHGIVYNSQVVMDRGTYLGLQRKINLSGNEYLHFGAGETLPVFDIGDLRFGIIICFDNHFPELALLHSLSHVDVILAPHAARCGVWPDTLTPEFIKRVISERQRTWEQVHVARALDHNVFVLLNNAVGPSTRGLEGVVANHAGTVMGVAPDGEVFLRTGVSDLVDEVVTVELKAERRAVNHAPTRNRRLDTVVRLLQDRRTHRLEEGA